MTELHKFNAEVSKVLKLVIHSLYTNRDIFLRELISNASDACDKRRYLALTDNTLATSDELAIRIHTDAKTGTITITDSGIGMNKDELINNLGTIAKSGTEEFITQLSGDGKKDASLIGQFGVGFYSSFMVADKVTVVSRKADESLAHQWESDGLGEFSVIDAGTSHPIGTSITLFLKEEAREYLDFYRLKHIVQTYSDHVSFPIYLAREEGESERVNQGSALWVRPKSEITEAQYKDFYHHVAHQPDDPWLTLHYKAEGNIEYSALLYVPTMRPFDLFHPDRARRVKLYVKRVFITDEGVDLIPHYLRFLRGVIDSEDLPLNISRETLQANPTLTKIREAVTKKFLQELNKKAEQDSESYAGFWKNFGAVLKEGLCEANTPRELLLDTCRFHTTTSDALVSLKDYTQRMKEGQDCIYYLTGERLEIMRSDPKLEGFQSRGIEVLLLNDHVDDFWLSLVHEYGGKPLKSITRADIDLSNIASDISTNDSKINDKKEEADALKQLTDRIKEVLGSKVEAVRTTNKLGESPACLAVKEGAMDMRLERFLIEQKQLQTASAKILEINPKHAVIQRLLNCMQQSASAQEITEISWMLYDQAKIIEGEPLDDPAAFIKRLNNYVVKAVA
jgi:molecular chaperone HtpG